MAGTVLPPVEAGIIRGVFLQVFYMPTGEFGDSVARGRRDRYMPNTRRSKQ